MLQRAALALVVVGLASLGASTQDPEEMFVPGTTYINCGGMSPAFEFTHEDFQRGFTRTYSFPGTTRCELGELGDRGGTVKLSYTPGENASLRAELKYWEVVDCSDSDGPKTAKYSYTWSGGLEPTDSDPDGVFPAASFGQAFLRSIGPGISRRPQESPPKVTVQGNCDAGSGPEPRLTRFRVGLVSKDRTTGDVYRTAYLWLRGDGLGVMGEIAFVGGGSESEVEVDVEPVGDYEGWKPTGNISDASKPGNELRVKAKVHQKGDPESIGKAKLRFGFNEVSREKGVCLNWPPSGADTKPDLRLRFADPVLGNPSDDGTSIETTDLVEEAELIVDAYDFGAWGTLRVSAKDKDKRDVVVKVRGRQNPDLSIPLDEDANHVADAWKPAVAKDKPGDADDEHQEGNENDGDGLTLYEEYRGFVENFGREEGGRKQGDPLAKDFFVLNLAGEEALMGLNLFEKATKLNVHQGFSRAELDPNQRWINRYSSVGAPQHGVVVEWMDTEHDPPFSEAIGGPGTPETVSSVRLSRKKMADDQAFPESAYGPADVEVAHELMHAVNVWHHGEGDWDKVQWYPGLKAGEIREIRAAGDASHVVRVFIEDDGTQLTPEQVQGQRVWLGRQGGQHSGGEECLVRYAVGGLLAYEDRTEPDKRLLVERQRPGVELCRSRAGTLVNKRWGVASRGNCFGQIKVRDRGQSRR